MIITFILHALYRKKRGVNEKVIKLNGWVEYMKLTKRKMGFSLVLLMTFLLILTSYDYKTDDGMENVREILKQELSGTDTSIKERYEALQNNYERMLAPDYLDPFKNTKALTFLREANLNNYKLNIERIVIEGEVQSVRRYQFEVEVGYKKQGEDKRNSSKLKGYAVVNKEGKIEELKYYDAGNLLSKLS